MAKLLQTNVAADLKTATDALQANLTSAWSSDSFVVRNAASVQLAMYIARLSADTNAQEVQALKSILTIISGNADTEVKQRASNALMQLVPGTKLGNLIKKCDSKTQVTLQFSTQDFGGGMSQTLTQLIVQIDGDTKLTLRNFSGSFPPFGVSGTFTELANKGSHSIKIKIKATSNSAEEVIDPPLVCTCCVCDINGDGKIDISDINAIFAARNTNASGPDDPRDADGDGLITTNDARLCTLVCTKPQCLP